MQLCVDRSAEEPGARALCTGHVGAGDIDLTGPPQSGCQTGCGRLNTASRRKPKPIQLRNEVHLFFVPTHPSVSSAMSYPSWSVVLRVGCPAGGSAVQALQRTHHADIAKNHEARQKFTQQLNENQMVLKVRQCLVNQHSAIITALHKQL